jgi:hypothetical protein
MRAVSSPSLTENILDVPISPKFSSKPEPNEHVPNHELNDHRGHQQTGNLKLYKIVCNYG